MRLWQEQARESLKRAPMAPQGSLGADVALYLATRTSMPTALERARHLELWAQALGAHRPRELVTALEIRGQLERWLRAGSSPGTCNRRRTALQSFYTVLNGRSGANPVRDVPRYTEPDRPPRRIDYATFDALLAAMPDRGQRLAGESPTDSSHTKARLRVIAYTGLPHAQVARLKPEHLLAAERLLFVHGRHKGSGTGDVWLPLSDRGLEAVSGLFAAKATGAFSRGSMYKSFQRAARKIGRPDLRPYDLRHLFGQTVLRLSGNRAATRDLMLHRSDKTTARYVASEIPGELRVALAQFDAEVVASGCGTMQRDVRKTPRSR
jgi:integrase